MVEVKNIDVYNLDRAKRSVKNSFAVEVDTTQGEFPKAVIPLGANMDTHQSHDAWLKGVLVCFDMKYDSAFMPEFQRYHWCEIVMSTSTMHSMKKMMKSGLNPYSKYVTTATKMQILSLYELWEEKCQSGTREEKYEAYMKLIHNLPRGFELQCTITTNYLALKTIVIQRFGHKQREDWQNFISACYSMPEFREVCGFTDSKWDLENWK